jgi:hypothetical protein
VGLSHGLAVKRHVDFLAWLYVAWGALFLLVSIAGFALAGGAYAMAGSNAPDLLASPLAARLTALSIAVLSVLALVWAVLHLWIGRALGAYRPWARLLALGLAVVNLVVLPAGTALGAYACWVLLKEEGRKVFVG